MKSRWCLVSVVSVAALAAACSNNNNSSSTAPSGLTGSVTAPKPLQPSTGAVVRFVDQPVMLIVQNAVATQGTPAYTFEVSTDSAFSDKVQVKDNVTAGTSGQTAVKLDALTGNKDYYWHARVSSGGTTGQFGGTYKFTVGPAIQLDAPTPILPLNGSTSAGWPIFRVADSGKSGPVGVVQYKFEISTSATFSPILLTGTVPEAAGQTTFVPAANQPPPPQNSLFWRATAVDVTNNVTSSPSATQTFTYAAPTRQAQLAVQAGYVLWPGVQPPGQTGNATLGGNWDVAVIVSFDGVRHTKPTLEELQVFDLLDRGMDPNSALAWLNANGYGTTGVYYSDVKVIGFPFEYMALVDGSWQLVVR
ncbi:MAG TPA: hypothetical protein VL309_01640, partial [Vicinamibacterales bacterium]|nr:hypothetical protein [Vicinamibacterales bacterium]